MRVTRTCIDLFREILMHRHGVLACCRVSGGEEIDTMSF
jgi:hypothetical protein